MFSGEKRGTGTQEQSVAAQMPILSRRKIDAKSPGEWVITFPEPRSSLERRVPCSGLNFQVLRTRGFEAPGSHRVSFAAFRDRPDSDSGYPELHSASGPCSDMCWDTCSDTCFPSCRTDFESTAFH